MSAVTNCSKSHSHYLDSKIWAGKGMFDITGCYVTQSIGLFYSCVTVLFQLFPGVFLVEKHKQKLIACLICCVIEQRHVVTAKLVRAVTSSCLIQRLKAHGYRNPDHSRALSKFYYGCSLSSRSRWRECCHFIFCSYRQKS